MTLLEIVAYNIPPKFRVWNRFLAWIKVLITPSIFLNDAYDTYVENERYKLSFNSQVMYLEHRLNDALDNSQRRIYIDDTLDSQVVRTVIFRKTDGQPSSVIFRKTDNAGANKMSIWRKGELDFVADFVVFIPSSLNTEGVVRELKNIVNFYKVAGRRYIIQTF